MVARAFFRVFLALLKKDLILASRTRDSGISVLFFSFLVVLIFHFGFSQGGAFPTPAISAFIWLTTLFGGMLRINQTFEAESAGRVMEAMRLLPHTAIPFYVSKFLGNLLFLVVLEIFSFVLSVVLFGLSEPLHYLRVACLPFFLGAIGFSGVGTLFSGMTAAHGRRDILLPIILYPVLVPLIIGAVKSLVYSASHSLVGLDPAWILILVVFDIVYLTLSVLVFEAVMET